MTKIWVSAAVGCAHLMIVIDFARWKSWDGISRIAAEPRTRWQRWSAAFSFVFLPETATLA
jgi:hypothetical protein